MRMMSSGKLHLRQLFSVVVLAFPLHTAYNLFAAYLLPSIAQCVLHSASRLQLVLVRSGRISPLLSSRLAIWLVVIYSSRYSTLTT